MSRSLSPSVFASPGSSRKDGCSRGPRHKGLPGRGFIFTSQLLSVPKQNKTATPACQLFLNRDLFLTSSLVLCQVSICITSMWFFCALVTHMSLQSLACTTQGLGDLAGNQGGLSVPQLFPASPHAVCSPQGHAGPPGPIGPPGPKGEKVRSGGLAFSFLLE